MRADRQFETYTDDKVGMDCGMGKTGRLIHLCLVCGGVQIFKAIV